MTTVAAVHAEQITIRLAAPDDAPALLTLAQLDSAGTPAEPVLLAEAGAEPRAALSLRDGQAIADPFFPTEHLLALLRMHAAQVAQEHGGGTRRRRRTSRAVALSPARAS
jgi:hypothetical protein